MDNWLRNYPGRYEKEKKSLQNYTHGIFDSTEDAIELQADQVIFFPQKKEVIASTNPQILDELFPLCSFSLRHINSSWKGKAHFIYAFREYDDYPTEKWYNEHCDDYILGFKRVEEQIQLLGEPELFGCSESYQVFKSQGASDYNESKAKYNAVGMSYFEWAKNTAEIIRQVGSKPFWVQGNYTPPVKDIQFIAQFDSGMIIEGGPYLFLFYDPKNEIFYQVEQFL